MFTASLNEKPHMVRSIEFFLNGRYSKTPATYCTLGFLLNRIFEKRNMDVSASNSIKRSQVLLLISNNECAISPVPAPASNIILLFILLICFNESFLYFISVPKDIRWLVLS